MAKVSPQPPRLNRLIVLRDRISAGKDVARRDLKNALTEEEWEQFEEALNSPASAEPARSSRPSSLDRYVELLAKADFLYSRAESTRVTSRSRRDSMGRPGRERLYALAEQEYERAIEYLSEVLSICDAADEYEIRAWLDRVVDFAHGAEPSPSPAGVPRLLGSRSQHAEAHLPNKHDQKRQLKLQAIESAIASLTNQRKLLREDKTRTGKREVDALRALARNR